MRRHMRNSLRRFERLEDRRMMAADIELDNGILSIEVEETIMDFNAVDDALAVLIY
jgi:hypothetical protein